MTARMMIVPGCSPSRDANGRALPAKLRFYLPDSGGVLTSVYTSSTLATAHSQPIDSDATGYFPEIWADDANTFDVALTRQDTDAPIDAWEGIAPLNGDFGEAAALVSAVATPIAKTANFTAVNGARYLLDSTGGAFTATAPASPAVGNYFILEDNGGSCGTNNVTVGRNGSTIDSVASNWAFDVSYGAVYLTYSGSTWIPRRYY